MNESTKRMKLNSLLSSALILSTVGTHATTYTLHCPSEIKTQQQLLTSDSNWEPVTALSPHFLSSISFYLGHPKEQASLKPKMIDNHQAQWTFAREEPIYITCHYQNTVVELTQRLSEQFSECTVRYNLQQRGDHGALPETIRCKK